jgi:hypothetical protein
MAPFQKSIFRGQNNGKFLHTPGTGFEFNVFEDIPFAFSLFLPDQN